MPLYVGEIYHNVMQQYMVDMAIAAGQTGLDRFVLRVISAETRSRAALVEPYDIAFVSGEHNNALELVQMVLERKASAVVLNKHTCSAEARRILAKTCTEWNVPLIEIEKYKYFSTVTALFEKALRDYYEERTDVTFAFQNLLSQGGLSKHCLALLKQYGYDLDTGYCAAVLYLEGTQKTWFPDEQTISRLKMFVEAGVNEVAPDTVTVQMGNRIIVIFDDKWKNQLEQAVACAIETIPSALTEKCMIYAGIGRYFRGMEKISESFVIASKTAAIQRQRGVKNMALSYKDLGITKVLMQLDGQNEMVSDFCDEIIKPLMEFDRCNGTDYVRVLRIYLEYGGHVDKMAESMYVHRNTINYKLARIRELFGRNLSDLNCRTELLVALKLVEIGEEDERLWK